MSTFIGARTLRIANTSEPTDDGRWTWTAWIEGLAADLDDIASVTYKLHPSFVPPRRTVTDRRSKFALRESGWGEFLLSARIEFRGGELSAIERWLELGTVSDHGGSRRLRPRVFVSASVADRPLVDSLRIALTQRSMEFVTVETSEDVATGGSIRRLLQSVDVVIAVISTDPPPRFVMAEVQEALELGRPILPIMVGAMKPAAELASVRHIRVKGIDNDAALADSVAARVMDLTTRKE